MFAGFGVYESPTDDIINVLDVKQVKITDADGNLRRVYPSKSDMKVEEHENVIVERE